MLNLTDLQIGTFIMHQGDPHIITYCEHSKHGRGGSMLRTKLKNIRSGAIIDYTFKGADKITEADISRSKTQFLYRQGETFHFMRPDNFEQFKLTKQSIGTNADFLKEGEMVDVLLLANEPINISLPIKVELKIAGTEPGIRGDTAQGSVTKPAILETGAKIQVPIFIKPGSLVRINTETGEYVERVKK